MLSTTVRANLARINVEESTVTADIASSIGGSTAAWPSCARLSIAHLVCVCLGLVLSTASAEESATEAAKGAYVEPLPEGAIARLGVTRFRAAGQLYGVKLSADGRALATLNAAGTLRMWDAETGRLVTQVLGFGRLRYGEEFKLQIALSHDGRTVAVVDGAVRLHDAKTFEPRPWRAAVAGSQRCGGVRFSADDGAVIVAQREGATAFSAESGEQLDDFEIPDAATSEMLRAGQIADSAAGRAVAEYWNDNELGPLPFERMEQLSLSADGSLLAVGSSQEGNRVRLFNVNRAEGGGKTVSERLPDDGHFAGIKRLEFLGGGQRLLSTGIDNTARIWNVATREPGARIEKAYKVGVSDDGRLLGVYGLNSGNDVRLFDLGMSDDVQLRNTRTGTGSVDVSPSGEHLAYMQPGTPAALVIEEVATGEVVRRIETESSTAYSLKFSPDGKAVAHGARHPRVWDVASGELLLDATSGSPYTIAFTPDSRHLVTAAGRQGKGGAVQFWSVTSGELVRSFGEGAGFRRGVVMQDNRRLIGGCFDGQVRVWDLQTGDLLKTLPAHRRYITAIALSADDTKFATGCIDSEILLWDAARLPLP